MHFPVCVVDKTATKSDSRVDDRQEDDAHFINGILLTDSALSVQILGYMTWMFLFLFSGCWRIVYFVLPVLRLLVVSFVICTSCYGYVHVTHFILSVYVEHYTTSANVSIKYCKYLPARGNVSICILIAVLLIVSISFVGLAICLIIIFVGIGCARRSVTSSPTVTSLQLTLSHLHMSPVVRCSLNVDVWCLLYFTLWLFVVRAGLTIRGPHTNTNIRRGPFSRTRSQDFLICGGALFPKLTTFF